MSDPFDLGRFVTAQANLYDTALAEIRRGRKSSHWMWFIFPQLQGLGHSSMAQRYAIGSLAEARAYLDHPLLGNRLRECTAALLPLKASSAEQVFGPIDARKLQSSLTLFAETGEPIFNAALAHWFGGHKDDATLTLLGTAQRD